MDDIRCKRKEGPVLLVEGQNDCHVVLAIKEVYKLSVTFDIHDCGSDAQALSALNALISSSTEPRVVGLVIDADSPNLAGRWTSILNKLEGYGYPLPAIPEPKGTIVEPISDYPRLGFWLMPDNQIDGMLEDFCIDMIDAKAVATVEQCLQIAVADGCATFKPAHRRKALLHTYLAWQDKPGRQIEHAITQLSLRPDTATAQAFADWLTALFR